MFIRERQIEEETYTERQRWRLYLCDAEGKRVAEKEGEMVNGVFGRGNNMKKKKRE